MKRTLKTAVCLLACLVLCLALTSCDALDDARDHQAFYGEDGSILWQGNTYRALPVCEELSLMPYGRVTVYITEEDVPVLLASMLGAPLDVSADEVFLVTPYYYQDTPTAVYCRTDRYDEIATRIQNGVELTCYSYEGTGFYPELETYGTKTMLASAELTEILNNTLAKAPLELPKGAKMDYAYCTLIHRSSEDLMFRKYAFEVRFSTDNSCYIAVEDLGTGGETYYSIDDSYAEFVKSELFDAKNFE